MTEQELIEKSPFPRFTQHFREAPFVVGELLAVIGVLSYLLYAAIPIEAFFLCLIITWFFLSRWIFGHKRIQERTSATFRLAVLLLPVITTYFIFQGISAAKADISEKKEHLRKITIRGGSPLEGRILRSYQNVLVIWMPQERQIRVMATNDIESITSSLPDHDFGGVLRNSTNISNEEQVHE